MTRHGKNVTASAVYTHHERKKDHRESGYGSDRMRLGKDSVKEFDCCSLTLQPCANPVVTPQGNLFDKEAILEYIIHQKREIARKLKEYEKQKGKLQKEDLLQTHDRQQKEIGKFIKTEESIISKAHDPFKKGSDKSKGESSSVSNMSNGKNKQLPSFWLPSQLPQAEATKLKKPDEKVRCPISGAVLKLKDLITVNFTAIQDRDNKKSLITKDARYVCAVTNDVLSNSIPAAVLRTSGSVVTMECVEKLIKKDMLDPINGKKLTDKDIIPLQRGASSFSATGLQLEAEKAGPSMMA